MAEPLLRGRREGTECFLPPAMANRHGLVDRATGTGKTVTLQTLAENFSPQGVPVFMAEVEGDLTAITQTGSINAKMAAMLKERGIEAPTPAACPATLWDVFADDNAASRHPVRATVSDMGPLLQINAQGGDMFFGEPMLDIADFMQTAAGPAAVPATSNA